MVIHDFTPPMLRASLPFCFVVHRAGRWVGICCLGPDEHETPRRFGTRAAALADAKRIAATLAHHDVPGAL